MFVTERAVFALQAGQLVLTEIAPGIDLKKDVLELMDFEVQVSESLQEMPAELFMENWGKLAKLMEEDNGTT